MKERTFWVTYGGLVIVLISSFIMVGQKSAQLEKTIKEVEIVKSDVKELTEKLNSIEVAIGKVETKQDSQKELLEKIYNKVQ